ncbi:hypothetical protein PG988_006122 [Apiospora saccharicola]
MVGYFSLLLVDEGHRSDLVMIAPGPGKTTDGMVPLDCNLAVTATRSRRLPGIPEIILVVRRHVARDVVPGVTRAAGLVETAVVGDVAPRRLGRFDAGLEANPGARGHADEGDDAAHELVEALARLDSVVPVDAAAGDVGVPLEELGRGIDVGRRLGGTLRGGKGREFMVEGVGQPLVQLLTGAPVVHHVGAIGLAMRDTDDRRWARRHGLRSGDQEGQDGWDREVHGRFEFLQQ